MSELAEAVIAGASADKLLQMEVPTRSLAVHLRREDVGIFQHGAVKDVQRSIHVGEVPLPELAPDEALVAVMASAINYNTVWSALFEPVPAFRFLEHMGRQDRWAARHDQPYHVIGSDASGVIVRVGGAVRNWKVGDHVVVAPAYIDAEDPASQDDGMLAADQRAWGFETNFGGLAHFTLVKASQLLSKPSHLSWEEAASCTLCLVTAYRMLVSRRGAQLKQGDVVLIWGAAGGLGAYAVQLVKNGGGVAIGVVGSERKAEVLARLGCDMVINRHDLGLDAAESSSRPHEVWRALGSHIRRQLGEDPHIVFEHVGRETFGASVFVVRRGGVIVTCGSSTGYMHEFDNRYLWMKLKRIVGCHGANHQEAWEANRLVRLGRIVPTLSRVFTLAETASAARLVQCNDHVGKIGVLCLAPRPGLGIQDSEARQRVGEDRLMLFRHEGATA